MSGAAEVERDTGTSAAKRKPDQVIYRPGMFKRGIDLTQTKPKAENQPPPSERKLRQMQEREKIDRSHGPAAASASFHQPRVCIRRILYKNFNSLLATTSSTSIIQRKEF